MTLLGQTTPFVSLKVGTMELGNVNLVPGSKDPRYIQSFKISRLNADNKNDAFSDYGLAFTAEFVISMVTNLQLEKYLIEFIEKNGPAPEVTFQYGHADDHRKSPVYSGVITKLGLSEDFYTLTMTVNADGLGSIYRNYNDATWKAISNTTYKRPSDLVTAIATGQGWKIGNIEKTKELSYPVRVTDISTGPYQFIKNNLIKGVTSEKGEGSYASNLIYTKEGIIYYYEPTKFLVNRYNYKNLKSYNFVIRMKPDGQVISFKPTLFDGTPEALLTAKQKTDPNKTSNLYGAITKDTKEVVNLEYTFGDKSNSSALDPRDKVVMAYGMNPVMNANAADIAKYGEGSIKDDINSYAYSTAIGSKATMVVIGDPDLRVMDYINVMPMYPLNDSSRLNSSDAPASSGVMHPSGGTYMITGIVDEISDQFTTTLELVKMNDTYTISEIKAKNLPGGTI